MGLTFACVEETSFVGLYFHIVERDRLGLGELALCLCSSYLILLVEQFSCLDTRSWSFSVWLQVLYVLYVASGLGLDRSQR